MLAPVGAALSSHDAIEGLPLGSSWAYGGAPVARCTCRMRHYPTAKNGPLACHPLGAFIRGSSAPRYAAASNYHIPAGEGKMAPPSRQPRGNFATDCRAAAEAAARTSVRLPMVMRSTAPDGRTTNYAQMPRKNRQSGPITSARGPNGSRPATDRAGPYRKPGKSLRSASNSRSIRGIAA